MASSFITPPKLLLAVLVLMAAIFACARAVTADPQAWQVSGLDQPATTSPEGDPHTPTAAPASAAVPRLTPSPDPPRILPLLNLKSQEYIVQPGDTLNKIAQRYVVSVAEIVAANQLDNADHVEVGQQLTIPPSNPQAAGPGFKVIPDSELVYSPAAADFDLDGFITSRSGYLASFTEELDERSYTGSQVVGRVAQEFSVNPRLLLAVLEYQSRWVTQANPPEGSLKFPIGVAEEWRKGLYYQLTWAANNLNRGYYLWRVNGVAAWLLADGAIVPLDPTLNAGTAGVQHFFSQLYGRASWEQAVTAGGLLATYQALFGNPFDQVVEPLVPPDLQQPALQLPFGSGETWAFTGGPHGGWGSGSGWAALDFAPPGETLGCVLSDAWVLAAADGPVVRSGGGAVVQDLDGDGREQTGWTLLYMHIETRQRVEVGVTLKAGDRIGHPSCEGGVSTGTHVHLARRYNGEWIPADQSIPFVLDGWRSFGRGVEYDGYLQKGDLIVEALEGWFPENAISR